MRAEIRADMRLRAPDPRLVPLEQRLPARRSRCSARRGRAAEPPSRSRPAASPRSPRHEGGNGLPAVVRAGGGVDLRHGLRRCCAVIWTPWCSRRSKSTPCGATLSRDSRSWLNQVEIWFAKIQRYLIDRGIFISTTDLRRKIMSYIRLHKRNCRPFRWTYRNTKQRIRVDEKPVTAYSRAGTGAVRPVSPNREGDDRYHHRRASESGAL
jgi:hypothetical protein